MLMVHPINRRPSSSRLSARGSAWRDNLASHGCRIAAMLSVLMLPSSLVAQTTSRNAAATFTEIAKVLTHPRCLNCHPRDDRPRQGPAEATRWHQMNVQRGPDGHGRTGQRCATCHRDINNAASGVPGAHNWHLAPLSMGWQGLSTAELRRTLKDTTKNGNRSPQALLEHFATDPLVRWGWEPGAQRAPIPIPHADFVKLVEHWVQTGAECPPS
jgi:hypothetical protein